MKIQKINRIASCVRKEIGKPITFRELVLYCSRLGYAVHIVPNKTRLGAWTVPKDKMIFIANVVRRDYATFLLAHELGHIILQHDAVFTDDNTASENEADRFAQCLLEPPARRQIKIVAAILLTIAVIMFGISMLNDLYIKPATTTVYVTEHGSRYHTEDCPYVKNKNIVALSIQTAKEQGYMACKVCRP